MSSISRRRFLKGLGVGALTISSMGSSAFAATNSERHGGALKIATNSTLPTLDAHASTLVVVQDTIPWIQEGLGALDANYKPRPMLAESWAPNEDNSVWTINLREGVSFHNGKEMTATDVKASLDRWTEFSPTKARLDSLREITIEDPYTLKLHFDGPFGILPLVLSTPGTPIVIMPEEQTKTTIGKIYEPIGTGPYKFKERSPNEFLKLERFDNYWQMDNPLPYDNSAYAGHKIAYTDEVHLYPVPEVSTRLAGLRTGQYHIIYQVPVGEFSSLEQSANQQPVIVKPGRMHLLFLNKRQGIMQNRYLRRAVKLAQSVEPILKAITEGKEEFYRIDPGLFYQEMIWHSVVDRGLYNVGSVEEAKQWMEQANYGGEKIRFMATKDYPTMYRASLVIKQQLEQAGLNIDYQIYDWPTLTTRRAKPELWDIFITYSTNMYDPYMWSKHIGAGEYPGWSESFEMKHAYQVLGKESDFDIRYRQAEILQFHNAIEGVMQKIGDDFYLRAQQKGVNNPNAGSQRFVALNTWLEQDLRS